MAVLAFYFVDMFLLIQVARQDPPPPRFAPFVLIFPNPYRFPLWLMRILVVPWRSPSASVSQLALCSGWLSSRCAARRPLVYRTHVLACMLLLGVARGFGWLLSLYCFPGMEVCAKWRFDRGLLTCAVADLRSHSFSPNRTRRVVFSTRLLSA